MNTLSQNDKQNWIVKSSKVANFLYLLAGFVAGLALGKYIGQYITILGAL